MAITKYTAVLLLPALALAVPQTTSVNTSTCYTTTMFTGTESTSAAIAANESIVDVNATGTGAYPTNGTRTWAPTVQPTVAPTTVPSDGGADGVKTSLLAAALAFGGLTWAFAEL